MLRTTLILVASLWFLAPDLLSQEAGPAVAPSTTSGVSPTNVPVGPDGKPISTAKGAAPATPDGKTKTGEANNKESANGKKSAEDNGPKDIKRSEKPPMDPNKDELKAKPDDDGLISFAFRYQRWPDVLDWLARVSHMSLDWQDLPGDFLNLTTQQPYTVEKVRDLINRHLLLRGFTMLENGDLLSVAKISAIDVGMVPRITAEHIERFATTRPHAFIKVSFQLDWMLAEQAVEELKPMLSPNGRLNALKNTNRLEAMDAAINLLDLWTILKQEQSDHGQDRLVKEFRLTNVRASDVVTQLEALLGLESKKSGGPMTSQEMQQVQQMQRQLQQQMQQAQRNASKAPSKSSEEAKVHLIVNQHQNSILANAPPDKMAIIEQAVQALDVKSSRSDSILAKPYQVEVYRLHTLSPVALAGTLEDLGQLDPVTRLQVDEQNNSLVVYGSLVDHVTIRQLVQRLDGSTRKFEVVRLRRLPADYVAGTIEFMMVGQDKDEGAGYDPYYYYRYGAGSREQKKEDAFRVDADVENNLLLLWASDPEIESVMQLLVKIGELPPAGGDSRKVRVLDAIPPEQAAEFLDKLRKAWPTLGPNDLNLPVIPELQEPKEKETPRAKAAKEAGVLPRASVSTFVQLTVPDAMSPSDSQEAADDVRQDELMRRFFSDQQVPKGNAGYPQPIDLSIGPDGRITIRSDDTRALDLFEELIRQVAPQRPDYRIFHLVYADAYWVKLNLEEFFDEEETESSGSGYPYFYYGYSQPQKEEPRYRLSQRRKLKFIYELDTNSILVQGGDSQQLQTVEQLINTYDQPPPEDSKSARMTSMFQIKFSKASAIAQTLKEVYRDLLSSNDKALASSNPEKKEREPNGGITYIYGSAGGDEEPERTQIRFKGKLSLGVDEVTNTLLVSCEGENMMRNITEIVERLDVAAQTSSTVATVKLSGNVNAARVREALTNLLLEQRSAPEEQSGEQPGQPQGPGRTR